MTVSASSSTSTGGAPGAPAGAGAASGAGAGSASAARVTVRGAVEKGTNGSPGAGSSTLAFPLSSTVASAPTALARRSAEVPRIAGVSETGGGGAVSCSSIRGRGSAGAPVCDRVRATSGCGADTDRVGVTDSSGGGSTGTRATVASLESAGPESASSTLVPATSLVIFARAGCGAGAGSGSGRRKPSTMRRNSPGRGGGTGSGAGAGRATR